MSNEVVHSLSVPSDQARFWLNTLTELADAGFIGKDLAGVIITWNKGAERLFGYTPREIVGRSISTIIPPDRMEEEAASNARIKEWGDLRAAGYGASA